MPQATKLLIAFIILCTAAGSDTPRAHAASTAPYASPWQRSHKINVGTDICFDETTPGRFFTNSLPRGSGTYVNNWQTGQNQIIQMRNYDACSEGSGYLFALNSDGATALRFNAGDPDGRMIMHYPNLPSLDGSVWYSFGTNQYVSAKVADPARFKPAAPGHLFVTSDAGMTWVERGAEFNGAIDSVQLVGANPRALYVLVKQIQANDDEKYALYFSGDAGATWDKRMEGLDPSHPRNAAGGYQIHYLSGDSPGLFSSAGSADTVLLATGVRFGGPHTGARQSLSTDGGRTFTEIGNVAVGQGTLDFDTQMFATPMGLVRLQLGGPGAAYDVSSSSDGGRTFSPLTIPFIAKPSERVILAMAAHAPNYLVLGHQMLGEAQMDVFVSMDGGRSWSTTSVTSGLLGVYTFGFSLTPPTLIVLDQTGAYALDLAMVSRASSTSASASTGMASMGDGTTGACMPAAPGSGFASPAFQTQWQGGESLAPNFWGPTVTGSLTEAYQETPGGRRTAQYFDKGRMELTNPANGAVTNGLLATELITGQIQIGDAIFMARPAAAIPVAGDPDNAGPTYAGLGIKAGALFTPAPRNTPTMRNLGQAIETQVALDGTVTMPSVIGAGSGPMAVSAYDDTTQHNVPQAFADYRNQVGLAAIGLAKSEAFLTTVKVGGVSKQVMVQVFERRVLTYTATNPPAYQVEMGNIGLHYYRWRYCSA